ncbi:unnamed protein product [Victoria cruziana]
MASSRTYLHVCRSCGLVAPIHIGGRSSAICKSSLKYSDMLYTWKQRENQINRCPVVEIGLTKIILGSSDQLVLSDTSSDRDQNIAEHSVAATAGNSGKGNQG